jgi:hypothetical protein
MTQRRTLAPEDIVTERRVVRRTALVALGRSLLGVASTAVVALRPAVAHAKYSDRDRGPHRDPAGHGHSGFSDRDGGPTADTSARGVCPERAWTDRDAGPGADPPGRGRGPCH